MYRSYYGSDDSVFIDDAYVLKARRVGFSGSFSEATWRRTIRVLQ